MHKHLLPLFILLIITLACASLRVEVQIGISAVATNTLPLTVSVSFTPTSSETHSMPTRTTSRTPTPFGTISTPMFTSSTPAPFFPNGQAFVVDETRMFTKTTGWGLAQPGLLLHTRDGGRTWRDVRPMSGVYVPSKSVFFLNSETAWFGMVESTSIIFWHTRDGGHTWKRETTLDVNSLDMSLCNSFIFDSVTITDIFFLDIANGWLIVTASDHAHSAFDVSLFFTTKTGGLTWELTYLASQDCSTSGGPDGMKQVVFWNLIEGWGAFASRRYDYYPNYELPYIGGWEIYHTHNGGESWESVSLPEPPGLLEEIARQQAHHVRCNAAQLYTFSYQVFGIRLVCLIPPSTSMAYYYITLDDGINWKVWQTETNGLAYTHLLDETLYYNPISGQLKGWRFLPQTEGGILQQTTDYGRTWTNLREEKWLWMRLDFINELIGWATAPAKDGSSGLYFTSDGGHTWEKIETMLISQP